MSVNVVNKETGELQKVAGGNSSSVLNLLNNFIDIKASNTITDLNRKWVDVNTTLSATMPQTGILLFFIKKATDGYSFYVDRNGKSVWAYDNFAGESDASPNLNLILGEATCMIPVMKGDTITVSSNALGTTDDEKFLITNCKILYNNSSIYTIDQDDIVSTYFTERVKNLFGGEPVINLINSDFVVSNSHIEFACLKYMGTVSGKKYFQGDLKIMANVKYNGSEIFDDSIQCTTTWNNTNFKEVMSTIEVAVESTPEIYLEYSTGIKDYWFHIKLSSGYEGWVSLMAHGTFRLDV